MEHADTLCAQNVEFLNVTAGKTPTVLYKVRPYRGDWRNSNAPNSYSEGAQIDSRPRHQLS
jgi:hypothetical protein